LDILLKVEIAWDAVVWNKSRLSVEGAAKQGRMQPRFAKTLTQSFQEEYHGIWRLATSLLGLVRSLSICPV
jgi:hypothetical protein